MKSSQVYSVLGSALITLVIIDAINAECQFTESLTAKSRWETQITKERRSTGAYYKFSGSRMEFREFTKTDSKKVDIWHCQQEVAENTYILKMDSVGPGGQERFMCVQFLVRGKKVIQRKHSTVQQSGDDSICNDLELDHWPLVWPEMDDDYSQCPLDGGFLLDVREYMQQESLCLDDRQILKPHLESECMKGEGIRIEFRHFECRGNLGMEIVQNLACLASWEDGGYLFTVLTDQDELWPKLWLMRLPRDNPAQRPIHAVLSKAIIADVSEYFGSNQEVPRDHLYELILTSDNYPSLCDNEAKACDGMCDSRSNQLLCQKDCGLCQPSDTISKCDFDPATRGQWEERDTVHGTKTITVTESMLYAGDLIPFKCYQLYADEWFEGTGRKALVTLFKNGCKPRYSCAEFQMKSAHVMTYRLSQSSVWPTNVHVSADDVCSEPHFADDVEPLGSKYRSKQTKILVRKGAKRQSVACNIQSTYMLNGFAKDGERLAGMLWNAALGFESSSDTILHETCGSVDNMSFHKARSMKCIASFTPDNITQFIIMEDKDHPEVIECWAIYTYEWESTERLMILPPSHCNEDTAFRVDFGDNMNYIAKYNLSAFKWGSDPCAKIMNGTSLPQSTTTSAFDRASVMPGNGDETVDRMVDPSKEEPAPASWSIKIGGLKSQAETLRPLQGLFATIFIVTLLAYN